MAGRARGDQTSATLLQGAADGGFDGNHSKQRDDEELRRMAAFRIRETSNRIAILAHNAQHDALRHDLLAVCQRLLDEERWILREKK